MVQFIRKHSKEGEIDMKHLIIVKFKENVWTRESEASRETLADIREIFDRTQQIEGVHTVNIYENVTPRPNRHDLMIEMEMDPEALPVYDDSAAHQEWKAKYGDAIQSKTIFDYE